jgi:predicted secreted protein
MPARHPLTLVLGPAVVALLVAAPAAHARTVTVAKTGQAVTLDVDDRLVLKLGENPSTAFEWITVRRPAFLRLVSSTYVPGEKATMNVGAGGYRYYRMRALRPGTGTVRLVYRRTFDPQARDRRFTVRVTVREPQG